MGRFKQWEELTIQDNFLFQKVMQNQRICKYLTREDFGHPDRKDHISRR